MKLQRLIAILTALLQKDRISATTLASMFEVSVRTIYRDIAALESAGIPIVTHTGVNGGIAIIDTYKIDKKLFTNQDISTLLTSLYSVSGSIPDASLNQTLEKIKGLIPAEYVQAIEVASKQLHIDMTPWSNNPRRAHTLKQIQKGLAENRLLRFSYTARQQEASLRTVEPHQLVRKENNWYLRGFCHQRLDFRTFNLRRMEDVVILPQTFVPRKFETGMTDFKDWKSEKLIEVVLIADASLRERILDYCRDECLEDLPDGKICVRFPFVESEIGYGVLLQMGHDAEVIAPAHVRAEVIRRIRLMGAVYGDGCEPL